MNSHEQELKDLRVFHDRFADAKFVPQDDGWHAEFDRRGKRISLRRDRDGKIYSLATSELIARSFKSLLAGPDFCNVTYLAKSLVHEYSEYTADVLSVPFQLDDKKSSHLSFKEIDEFLSRKELGAVFGIEGPAGAGKTHFIRRLAATRAQNLVDGSSLNALVIPVESSGKVLSAIDDRIDGALSALRATFNRSELPVLMKNGLIALAIDGFDELSDSRGYNNSWSALRELLRDIGGKGLIILSGRDSFIDKKVLQEVIGSSLVLTGTELFSIGVGFPSAESATSWICKKNQVWDSYRHDVEERLNAYSWLRRPFFVSQISNMSPDLFLESDDEPIIALCGAMVSREVAKIGMPSELSAADGEKIILSVLMEVARTMMDYEIDYVDPSLIEVAVQIACEIHAPHNEAFTKALVARARTLAFLEPAPGTGDRDNRKFAHEKIKAFFYSTYILDESPNSPPVPLGLRRTQLGISDLSIFVSLLRASGTDKTKVARDYFMNSIRDVGVGTTIGGNLTALLIACLPESNLDGQSEIKIAYQQVVDAVVPDKPVGRLIDIYINRLDTRGCNLTNLTFENCQVGELIISAQTRFGSTLPKVNAVLVEDSSGQEIRYYDDISKERELEKLRGSEDSGALFSIPDTLDTLIRLMLRGYWVRLNREDKRGRRLLDHDDWENVRNILEKFSLLEIRNIGAGGRPSEFVHLKRLEEFLSLESASRDILEAIHQIGTNN